MAIIKHKYSYFLLFMLAITIGGCIESYDPPVTTQDTNYLVVDAVINSTDGSASINLTRTLPLYSDESAPQELNASITIEDENGNIYPVSEIGSGIYEQNGLAIDKEKQYRLHIRTTDNQEYLSQFIPVKNSPPIDSIFWIPESDGTTIYVNTHDDSGNSRYYRWTYEETWEYSSKFYSILKLVDGEVVVRPPSEYIDICWTNFNSHNIFVGSSIKLQKDIISHYPLTFIPQKSNKLLRKYSILVRQQVITEEAYEYWLQVQQSTESLGSLYDPMPSQINGNIYNASDPSVPVIGFFSAGSTEEKRIFIEKDELPEYLLYYESSSCVYDSIPVDEIGAYSNQTLLITSYGYPVLEGYLTSENSCIDCRLQGGTTTKPSFWE